MPREKNYYKILGINEKASNNEIRKAFCKLTKELHPDTTSLNKDDAKLKLQVVLEAYENLNNENLRRIHDKKINPKPSIYEIKNSLLSNSYNSDSNPENLIGNRRPFSNGEMFSLFLLVLVIFLSLLLSLLFAKFAGKEIDSIPVWLIK